jgi:hypothetical protein
MKVRMYFIAMGLLLAITSLQAQKEKTVLSKVTEATLFFRGAELTHTANVMLEKGNNEVRIEGLSASTYVNSITIKTTKKESTLAQQTLTPMQQVKN